MPIKSNLSFRFTLTGRFSASEPLWFVVIDPENVKRLQSGYPPLIEYATDQQTGISTPWPAVGSFCGFFRLQPQSQGFPLTVPQLALQIIARIAEESRPPARVTAQLWAEAECLCDEAEAREQQIPKQ
jgi:hypothetical protein